jgi:hypothetical protein
MDRSWPPKDSKFDWSDLVMTQRGDTEADARAKMPICLLEKWVFKR